MSSRSIGSAELMLISDFPIEDEHIGLIVQLSGRPITRDDIAITASRRCATWPLQLESPGRSSIQTPDSHLWHIAVYLTRQRDVVRAIQELGCNLQLNIYSVSIEPRLSICASTLRQLGDLAVQLELYP